MSQPFTSTLTSVRRLTADNVHEIARLLRAHLTAPPIGEAEAIKACRALLLDGSMVGVVVDATDSGGCQTVAGVGGAVLFRNGLRMLNVHILDLDCPSAFFHACRLADSLRCLAERSQRLTSRTVSTWPSFCTTG
jgi:hypothetical protein